MSVYTTLFWFRCGTCNTVATSPVNGAYHCNLCIGGRSRMRFLFSEPIVNEVQQLLANNGPTYNPDAWLERRRSA